jgi:ABC-type uncharacterized transport system involved in gliding motility auxiliary subunit
MRTSLLFLPFLAVFIGAVGTAIGSAIQEIHWMSYAGWAMALVTIVLWVALDIKGFKLLVTRNGAKYGASSGLSILLGVLIIIGIAVLSSRPRFNKSFDATKGKRNTLSEQSIKIVSNTKEKNESIQVTAFFTDDAEKQGFKDLFDQYQTHGDVFQIEFIDPQTNPTKAMAANITTGSTVIFKHGDQEARVTTFNEEKITNALVNVLKPGKKKIYFTKGHGEGELKGEDATGYSTIAQELEGNKYEISEISLLESAKVPEDANMLIIAGPKYEFKKEELAFIDDYLVKGGSLLVMVDAMSATENLNGLLETYGIKFNSDLLILKPDDPRAQVLGQNNAIITEFDAFNPVTKDFAKQTSVALLIPNTRSIAANTDNPKTMKVDMVGKTAEVIVRVKDVKTKADLQTVGDSRVELGSHGVIAVAAGKIGGAKLAAKDTSKKDATDAAKDAPASTPVSETRIVAVGSSQFATNLSALRAENRDLFLNATSYLMQDEDFISIRPKDANKSTITLTSAQSQLVLAMLSFIYPFLFLGGGTLYWLRRRRA